MTNDYPTTTRTAPRRATTSWPRCGTTKMRCSSRSTTTATHRRSGSTRTRASIAHPDRRGHGEGSRPSSKGKPAAGRIAAIPGCRACSAPPRPMPPRPHKPPPQATTRPPPLRTQDEGAVSRRADDPAQCRHVRRADAKENQVTWPRSFPPSSPRADSSRPIPSSPPSTRRVRWPVLVCFLTAVHWMVVGTFLLVYASSLTHPQDTFPILGLFIDALGQLQHVHLRPRLARRHRRAGLRLGEHRGLVSPSGCSRAWAATPVQSPGALMTAVDFLEPRRRHRPHRHFPRATAPASSCSSSRPTPRGFSGSPTLSLRSGPS